MARNAMARRRFRSCDDSCGKRGRCARSRQMSHDVLAKCKDVETVCIKGGPRCNESEIPRRFQPDIAIRRLATLRWKYLVHGLMKFSTLQVRSHGKEGQGSWPFCGYPALVMPRRTRRWTATRHWKGRSKRKSCWELD